MNEINNIKSVKLDEKCVGKTLALSVLAIGKPIKLLNHGTVLTPELIKNLENHGITNICVRD